MVKLEYTTDLVTGRGEVFVKIHAAGAATLVAGLDARGAVAPASDLG